MKWEGQRESENVEDHRGNGGGGGGLPGLGALGGRGLGVGGIVVVLLLSWFLGVNPMSLLGAMDGGGGLAQAPAVRQPAGETANDPATRFAKVVLADTEDVWGAYFERAQRRYEPPTLVLYSGREATACGQGVSAMGPFYCPGDRKVYLDLSFNETLSQRLGAPGDFAQAYVIAHEVGHHIQNLLGTSARMEAARQRLSERDYNALSVRLELQADCLAGVWAFHSQRGKGWLEQGDLEEGLNAASRIGDDTLQREAGRSVVPESFTHGSSAQRVGWFKRGLQSGEIKTCDSFKSGAV
ncbi:neutral zinc metallopeptidase [Pelomonas sp. SE-A7]|uniref:KPN_02809 family neutral zinc metallopeptidase n=1 Tax=Pelomonas sp. SE-A7 TaxID=3054953 RepID=UPI00259CA3E6|nr:neutral zinc metallopeptidase [Pelomonas sp. SE-A7]MDM4768218.1 neutral zinc metallopeptidase [Pelomonas sp. SE-A7]